MRPSPSRPLRPPLRPSPSRPPFAVVLAVLLPWAAAGCGTSLAWEDEPRIEDPEPSGPAYLREYKEAYYRELGDRIAGELSEASVLERIAAARVLYVGDQHDDPAHHARITALVEALLAGGVPLVLGLEAIGKDDEGDVRDFLAWRLSLGELRGRLARRWSDSWLDNPQVDAAFYRRLLELARAGEMPVFALEPAPRLALAERDPVIAASVRRAAAVWRGCVVVVVVGHAHLLGQGRLIDRVGLPSVAVAGRLSVSLERKASVRRARATHPFLLTGSGILIFDRRTAPTVTRRPSPTDPS